MKPSAEQYAEIRLVLYRMSVLAHERRGLEPTMTANLRNALLIHNPNAGNGGKGRRRTLDTARHIFASRATGSDSRETRGPATATERARAPPSQGRGRCLPWAG